MTWVQMIDRHIETIVLFFDNIHRLWLEWRTRRKERREGIVVDIRSRFQDRGWR